MSAHLAAAAVDVRPGDPVIAVDGGQHTYLATVVGCAPSHGEVVVRLAGAREPQPWPAARLRPLGGAR